MSKKSNILIYLLGIYVVLQFIWWGYQIINLGALVDSSNAQSSRRVFMILGEGGVFILILLAGFWQIQKSIKKEIELSQNQNNFLLSVTHELKTPLTSIQLALQTLSKRDLNKEQTQTLIEKAISENERLKILIDNIIQASSIENKGLIADKTSLNIKSLLERIVDKSNKRQENNLVSLKCPNEFDILADIFMIETSIINESLPGEVFGYRIILTPDAQTIAVRSSKNENGIQAGRVTVFTYINGNWIQKGSTLNGLNHQDVFGQEISISDDGNILVVGAPLHDFEGSNMGYINLLIDTN